MLKNKKIIVVLPAFNAEKTLKKTVDEIPKDLVDDIILVDDSSSDKTVKISQKLGLKTFRLKENRGYGANQKTCYQKALELGADIVVMIHPDYQYSPKYIPRLINPIVEEKADAVFGSWMIFPTNALRGGMPYWKYLGNIFLTKIENLVLGLNLSEYHCGLRAYSKKVLETVNFQENSDGFVFDSEIIIQLKIHHFRIKEIPIETRYFKEASMISFFKSIGYGFDILKILCQFKLSSWGIIKIPKFQNELKRTDKDNY